MKEDRLILIKSIMEKAYVIMRKGFEYDDNIYNETEGGNPSLIVFSKEEAIEKVKHLNILEYKSTSIQYYGYDISDVLNVDESEFLEFTKSLVEKYGEIERKYSWESIEYTLHPMANEEESEKYYKMTSIRFFDIVETDIDRKSYRDKQISDILE